MRANFCHEKENLLRFAFVLWSEKRDPLSNRNKHANFSEDFRIEINVL